MPPVLNANIRREFNDVPRDISVRQGTENSQPTVPLETKNMTESMDIDNMPNKSQKSNDSSVPPTEKSSTHER